MKKKILSLLAGFGLLVALPVFAATVLPGFSGGTGIGTGSGGDVGNCLKVLSVGPLTWTTGTCGSGGGSGGGTWATSTAYGTTYLNYPLNATDVVMIGSTSGTSTAFAFFDPSISLANILGTASTTNLFVQGSSTLQNFTFRNATGTNATTTSLFSTTASSSNLFAANIQGAGLGACTGASQGLHWTGGLFSCATLSGFASSTLLGDNNNFSGSNVIAIFTSTRSTTTNATTTTLSSGTASSTNLFNDILITTANLLALGSSTLQNFTGLNSTTTNATTTTLFATTASTSALYIGAGPCSGSNALNVSAGKVVCGAVTTGTAASSTLLGDNNHFSGANVIDTFTATRSTTTQATTTNFSTGSASSTNLWNDILITTANFLALGSSTLQNFTGLNSTTTNATSTTIFATTASSTNIFGGALVTCNGTNALTWTGGKFGCAAVPQGTVTSVATSNGVSGGTFTTSGTLSLDQAFGAIWTAASSTYTGGLTIGNSTTTNATTTTLSATTASTTNLVVSGIKSAIFLTNSSGIVSGYGGASACASSNFVTAISALGATTCGTGTISGVNLGSNLGALTNGTTLLGSSYNGSGAISDWDIDLANGNVWTAASTTFSGGLTFTTGSSTSATSTNFFATTASTTNFFGGGLFTCNASGKALIYDGAGRFGCASIAAGAASSTLLGDNNAFTGLNTFTDLKAVTRSTTTDATSTTLSLSKASTTNLWLDSAGGTGTKCLQVTTAGLVQAASAACGSGGGGGNSKFGTTTATLVSNAISPNGGNNTVVGSGTSSPFFQLHVASTTGPQLALENDNGGTDAKNFILDWTGSALRFGTTSDTTLTSTSTALQIVPSGPAFFGIATGTPAAAPQGMLSVGLSSTTQAMNISAAGSSTAALIVFGANRNGQVSVGSSSPSLGDQFTVSGVSAASATKGTCFRAKDVAANTYTYWWTKAGVVTYQTTSCSGTGTTTVTYE